MKDGRISRVTFPTASFTLRTDLIDWINTEADRLGMSKSEFIRLLLDAAKQEASEDGLAAAFARNGDAA